LNVRQSRLFASQVLLIFLPGIICFEEFVEGIEVARLSCLCSFHQGKHQVRIHVPLIFLLCHSMLVLLASAW
jgi:hypothetical protein